jgi:formylglycine-generating enzyme required for sulfatase activity
LQAGEFAAAQLKFEQSLAIDPADSIAIAALAESLLRQDDNAHERILHDKTIVLVPNSDNAFKAGLALKYLFPSDPPPTPGLGVVEQPPLTAEQERALKPKDSFKECEDCPEMVVVPAGSFTMGSPPNEEASYDNERPQRHVTFARPFAVGKFAVTFEEWDACVADGGCNGRKPGDHGWGRGRLPVINVTWNDAKAYVAWVSRKTGKTYRLLSEAEWEYVARAGTTTPFWWGSNIETSLANHNGNYTYGNGPKGEYRGRTMPVDSFSPNPWGLYQMLGNVWVWTEDCYSNYREAPTDGSARTFQSCNKRVLRGGSWLSLPKFLRSAFRFIYDSEDGGDVFGFRVARTLEHFVAVSHAPRQKPSRAGVPDEENGDVRAQAR